MRRRRTARRRGSRAGHAQRARHLRSWLRGWACAEGASPAGEFAHKNQSGGGKERREVLAARSSTRESALYVQELPEWRGRALGPPTPASWPSWHRVLPPAGHSYPRLPLSPPAFLSSLGPTLAPSEDSPKSQADVFDQSTPTRLSPSQTDIPSPLQGACLLGPALASSSSHAQWWSFGHRTFALAPTTPTPDPTHFSMLLSVNAPSLCCSLPTARQVSLQRTELLTRSCLTICDPMHCSPAGSSVRGISQAKILEWVAISFSRGSS